MADSKAPAPMAAPTTPVPTNRLKQIANDACTLALEKADGYDHNRTESWNTQIINHILRALISESAPSSPSTPTSSSPQPTPWKFAVNSTIIQHLSPKAGAVSEGTELINGKAAGSGGVGRRGMHSACGAYWNNEKDGMWNYKYETRGMDVVVSIIWIAA